MAAATVPAAVIAAFFALVITGHYRPALQSRSHASIVKLPAYSHEAIITGA